MKLSEKKHGVAKKIKGASSFKEEDIRGHWSSGKPLENKGAKFRVGKMSYGDYFAEPHDPKHPEGRGERDNGGYHRSDTRWFEKHPNKKRRGQLIMK